MSNVYAVGKYSFLIACVAILIAEFELVTFAQRPSYPVGRRIEQMNRQADQYERDRVHRDDEKKTGKAGDRQRVHNVMAQVKEDFDRIQIIYNEIVVALSAGKKLDQTFISDSITGINKCATRLKSNLALPESKDKRVERVNQKEGEPPQSPLAMLLNHISEFVNNPMFESAGVLDLELSLRASRDLDEIIHLSDSLRKVTQRQR